MNMRDQIVSWVVALDRFAVPHAGFEAIYSLGRHAFEHTVAHVAPDARVALHGSAAIGRARPGLSDLDFTIVFDGEPTMRDYARLLRGISRVRRVFPFVSEPLVLTADEDRECRARLLYFTPEDLDRPIDRQRLYRKALWFYVDLDERFRYPARFRPATRAHQIGRFIDKLTRWAEVYAGVPPLPRTLAGARAALDVLTVPLDRDRSVPSFERPIVEPPPLRTILGDRHAADYIAVSPDLLGAPDLPHPAAIPRRLTEDMLLRERIDRRRCVMSGGDPAPFAASIARLDQLLATDSNRPAIRSAEPALGPTKLGDGGGDSTAATSAASSSAGSRTGREGATMSGG